MFWVISAYFNIRNTLPKSGTFLLGRLAHARVCVYIKLSLEYKTTTKNVGWVRILWGKDVNIVMIQKMVYHCKVKCTENNILNGQGTKLQGRRSPVQDPMG
jgi:hypothetical protein